MPNIKRVISTFRKVPLDVPLEIYKDKYKILVSTILSARTKDETTLEASERLFKKAPNLQKLNSLETKEIEKLIYPVGFYKTKAKHLKELSRIILEKHKGEIPQKRSDLVKLPGVGRKTANLVLNRAFKKPAIAVDTHVHKISNLLGWVKTKTPQETEEKLVKIIPKKYWKDVNRLFVSVGRTYRTKEKLIKFLKENRLIDKRQ
jgi:endonuclease-3